MKIAMLLCNISRKYTSAKYIFLRHLQRKNLTRKMIQKKSEVKQKSSCLQNIFIEPYLLNQPVNVFLRDIPPFRT